MSKRHPRVHGLFNIDKPSGMTSHDVVDAVRAIVRERRVGHAGTLDPLATGVLVVAVGQATRLIEFMMNHDKVYRVVIRLGVETTTYDAEGEVVTQVPLPRLTEADIERVLTAFRGRIRQIPPRYAAIRHRGKRLYEWAREGVEVTPKPREVTIYTLKLEAWTPPDLTLYVACSAGTYVRSLAHDIGQTLGVGGHVKALRRLASGPFRVEDAVPLDVLRSGDWRAYLLPPDAGLQDIPRVDLTPEHARRVRHGGFVPDLPISPGERWARAYVNGSFLAVLEWDPQRRVWRPRKVFSDEPI